MSFSLANLGNWWDGAQDQQGANPMAGYADKMKAAMAAGAPPQSPLVSAYTPPSYQTTPPHVDINAVIAAMNAGKPAAVPGAGGGTDPAGGMISGPVGGQNSFGGVGKDDGYTGKVDTFGDFVSSVLGGVGMVAGGLPGAIGAGINATNGFKNGIGLSGAAKTVAQGLGLMNSGPAVVGGVLNNTTPGDFSGKAGVETSSVGDSNSEHDFAGGDRGSAGDRTAEARGFAGGGPVTAGALAGPDPAGPDTGYAALQPGEYVIKKDAAEATGKKTLAKINQGDDAMAKKVAERVGKRNDGAKKEK